MGSTRHKVLLFRIFKNEFITETKYFFLQFFPERSTAAAGRRWQHRFRSLGQTQDLQETHQVGQTLFTSDLFTSKVFTSKFLQVRFKVKPQSFGFESSPVTTSH